MASRSVGDRARPEPEPAQPGEVPLFEQVGELGGSAGEHECVARQLGARELVEPGLPPLGRPVGLVEEHDEVAEHVERRPGPTGVLLLDAAPRR